MTFLYDYGLFLAKASTLLLVILIGIAGMIAMRKQSKFHFEIESLNDLFETTKRSMIETIKKEKPKKITRLEKKAKQKRPTLYLIDFEGDIKASGVDVLADSITAILSVAMPEDEVVLRLESPGGAVSGYGLCASQLQRLRDKGIPLTVCVDKIAASGGYLMACVANRIVAAPFAIVGSIGVVAQVPNFHRFLKKHEVDVELLTAGEFKRTLTIFGENTPKARDKFQEELEQIHASFKNFVFKNRPQLDLEKVSTGEHWLAIEAYDYRLVDVIKTSEDYLIEKMNHFNIFQLKTVKKQPLLQRMLKPAVRYLTPAF